MVTTNYEAEDHQETQLLIPNYESTSVNSQEVLFKRTGTIWTATAHIITGVIGAGVLSLAWSTAQLGWVAGPLAVLVLAVVTLISAFLVCDCYMFPDSEFGPVRHCSFTEAVKFYLGKRMEQICNIFVLESLYGTGVAYTITATESVSAIQKSNCYHRKGHNANCGHDNSKFMLIFGAVQIIMSQIPDFHNMAWLSIIAAVMSFSYAFIGFGLGLAKVIENGKVLGSFTGVPSSNTADKDTLKSPPPENKTMKNASTASIIITTFFYLCCGCFGYAAFGDEAPGNLLTRFGFYEPYWLVDFANACIVLHLVGGYQVVAVSYAISEKMCNIFSFITVLLQTSIFYLFLVYSQPIFALVEQWFNAKFPNSPCGNNLEVKLPMLPGFQLNIFRLWFRTAYVLSITGISVLFPYFNQVLGLLGALNFWSLGIYFPVEMFIVQRKISSWTKKWFLLEVFSFFCLAISVASLIGSVQGLINARLS